MRTEDAKEICKALHISMDTLRMGLEQGRFPFGTAVKTDKGYSYILYPKKVGEYVGDSISEGEAR